MKIPAYATPAATRPLAPWSIERRAPGPRDVAIDIRYCGVCHTDIHTARDDWHATRYPCVPGHEIVGVVTTIGAEVTAFAVGERVAVGCMVGSCGHCEACLAGEESYCENGFTDTYNGALPDGGYTLGGYASAIVVDQHFVFHVRHQGDLAPVAPLVCAGITTYSPLRHWHAGPGSTVGIVGLGGLGHMGVKLAHALGAHVILFTTSPGKAADARRFGADEVVISKDAEALSRCHNRCDLIIDTVAVAHALDPYLRILKRDGTLCLVGAPATPHPSPEVSGLIYKRAQIAGSRIGGIRETQEMLDFCAAHDITCDVEVIPIQDINRAYERMLKRDVKYRFVIDMQSLRGGRTGAP